MRKADEKMGDAFYEWLDKCPVNWFREEVAEDSLTYCFEAPDEED
jgi:hypothetical protein